jgi:hypothetical protein
VTVSGRHALELISSGTNGVVGFLSCVPGASQYRSRGSVNDRLWFLGTSVSAPSRQQMLGHGNVQTSDM